MGINRGKDAALCAHRLAELSSHALVLIEELHHDVQNENHRENECRRYRSSGARICDIATASAADHRHESVPADSALPGVDAADDEGHAIEPGEGTRFGSEAFAAGSAARKSKRGMSATGNALT